MAKTFSYGFSHRVYPQNADGGSPDKVFAILHPQFLSVFLRDPLVSAFPLPALGSRGGEGGSAFRFLICVSSVFICG